MQRLSSFPSILALGALAALAADAETGAAPPPESTAPTKAPAAKPSVSPKKIKMVEAIVRRGTVVVGDHGQEQHVGPGGKVTLPEDEVAALRKRGVLVDPEAAPSVNTGPKLENPE